MNASALRRRLWGAALPAAVPPAPPATTPRRPRLQVRGARPLCTLGCAQLPIVAAPLLARLLGRWGEVQVTGLTHGHDGVTQVQGDGLVLGAANQMLARLAMPQLADQLDALMASLGTPVDAPGMLADALEGGVLSARVPLRQPPDDVVDACSAGRLRLQLPAGCGLRVDGVPLRRHRHRRRLRLGLRRRRGDAPDAAAEVRLGPGRARLSLPGRATFTPLAFYGWVRRCRPLARALCWLLSARVTAVAWNADGHLRARGWLCLRGCPVWPLRLCLGTLLPLRLDLGLRRLLAGNVLVPGSNHATPEEAWAAMHACAGDIEVTVGRADGMPLRWRPPVPAPLRHRLGREALLQAPQLAVTLSVGAAGRLQAAGGLRVDGTFPQAAAAQERALRLRAEGTLHAVSRQVAGAVPEVAALRVEHVEVARRQPWQPWQPWLCGAGEATLDGTARGVIAGARLGCCGEAPYAAALEATVDPAAAALRLDALSLQLP